MKIICGSLMRLLLFYLLLLIPHSAFPQDANCAEKLKMAQTLFENGQVEQVPGMLKGCIKSGFNGEESILVYKLLIQTYLFEDELEEADSTIMVFLKRNPEYNISATDHSSFVNLYNNYNVKPLVQIAFRIGTNLPFIFVKEDWTLAGSGGKSVYSAQALNLFGAVEAKFEITGKLEINAEVGYSQISFSNVENFMDFGVSTYRESQKRIEIPVSATYNFVHLGKFTPYARLGYGMAFTLKTTAETDFKPTDVNNPFDRTGPDIDRKDSRITVDPFMQAGAGVKYKIRGGYFLGEVRSNFGFMIQTLWGGASAEELSKYYYVDDKFSINAMNFSLGYVHIFYKPSKRKP